MILYELWLDYIGNGKIDPIPEFYKVKFLGLLLRDVDSNFNVHSSECNSKKFAYL